MRVIGPVLVALLLLTSGGIGVRAEPATADPATAAQTPAPEPGDQGICPARAPSVVRQLRVPRHPVAAALHDARQVIELNTRGYNYSRPGDYRPERPLVPAAPIDEP